MTPLLNVKQAAEFLNVKEVTIYKWVHNGHIAFTNIAPNSAKITPRFRQEHLEILINKGANTKFREAEKLPTR